MEAFETFFMLVLCFLLFCCGIGLLILAFIAPVWWWGFLPGVFAFVAFGCSILFTHETLR